jgi:hypothetical protein
MVKLLDDVLDYYPLESGQDPTWTFFPTEDVFYLGLAGEVASEAKCSSITLPMLSRETYDWKSLLANTIETIISTHPQKHVKDFDTAVMEFSKEMFNYGCSQTPELWFGNKHTTESLSDERGLVLSLPNKVIALASNNLGHLAINERFFNFILIPKYICVYYVRQM